MDKEEVISELRRVAKYLNTDRLSVSQFRKYGKISAGTVSNRFGSWNQALEAAGLVTNPPCPPAEFRQRKISDEDLLQEIIRLTQELGKQPRGTEMDAKGRFEREAVQREMGFVYQSEGRCLREIWFSDIG